MWRAYCFPQFARTQLNGRKRHLLTDTLGLPVAAVVHSAAIQDRDGAPLVLATARFLYPWLRYVFADGGYGGAKLTSALAKIGRWTLEIVKRSTRTGFVVLPRRWVVERTLAWLNRNRRLAKDFEATLESARAWLYFASVKLLLRRLLCEFPSCCINQHCCTELRLIVAWIREIILSGSNGFSRTASAPAACDRAVLRSLG